MSVLQIPIIAGRLELSMKLKTLYLLLCVVGTMLPYSQLIPFLSANGLDIPLLVSQMFANRVAGFFGLDVIVSSIVLWVFVFNDGRRNGVKHLWAPIVANLAVGVSLGLPLFLYLREIRFEQSHKQAV